MSRDDSLELSIEERRATPTSVDEHWAVAVLPVERVAALLAYAASVVRGFSGGTPPPLEPPEDLSALASGYEMAARQALGRENPTEPPRRRDLPDSADRQRLAQEGSARAFLLFAAQPLPPDPQSARYHTLLLAGLSVVGERQHDMRQWLALHRDRLFGAASEADPLAVLDERLLQLAVELWLEVLEGSGPSGLDRAMELAATGRELLTIHRKPFLARLHGEERVRMEFLLFAVARLSDSAVEVLLHRLHGYRTDAFETTFLGLAVVGPAAAGNRVLWMALLWLQEAALRVIDRRTPQLDLLPHAP
ncbi:MAG: box helicase [Gemmatimonadetes bacterium]|nr:box helicase [Gemmatimonadota bacterium]